MSSLIYMKVLMDYVEGQNKNKTYICLMQDHLYVLPNILPCIFRYKLLHSYSVYLDQNILRLLVYHRAFIVFSEYFDAVAKLHSRHVVSPYFLTAYYILYV